MDCFRFSAIVRLLFAFHVPFGVIMLDCPRHFFPYTQRNFWALLFFIGWCWINLCNFVPRLWLEINYLFSLSVWGENSFSDLNHSETMIGMIIYFIIWDLFSITGYRISGFYQFNHSSCVFSFRFIKGRCQICISIQKKDREDLKDWFDSWSGQSAAFVKCDIGTK